LFFITDTIIFFIHPKMVSFCVKKNLQTLAVVVLILAGYVKIVVVPQTYVAANTATVAPAMTTVARGAEKVLVLMHPLVQVAFRWPIL
jgi:hypothetical protein